MRNRLMVFDRESVAPRPHLAESVPHGIVAGNLTHPVVPEAPALGTSLPSFGDRYRVERAIGRGGMATVYLCFDTKIERKVAIKVLHPDLAAAVGNERFHREIRITTALTHPNILPAYDSGETEGSLYYVMPYVEGESLRDRLSRERQLPVQDAINITCEIASALQYAHVQNIVHRDIKPENILLESGRAVLADFGIARAVTSAADVEHLTQTGMSLGTPTYMSPEQALGEKHIDGRSDQYSLACVLYEMLAGYPPFMANTMQALVAKHLGEPVPMITTVRPAVPDELEDVVMRALEKVPADRFPTIGEFGDALSGVVATTGTWARRTSTRTAQIRTTRSNRVVPAPVLPWYRRRIVIAGAAAAVLAGVGIWQWNRSRSGPDGLAGGLNPRTVAVLYFEDMSRDSSLAHAADGLTEGLIKELSRLRALDVISSRGVAPYRGSALSRDSIARALQAGTLIVGSIEPADTLVRLTARLVDGNSGADVERATFELPVSQLLVALDSLTSEAARLLRSKLGEEVRLQERRASTSNVDAWTRAQVAERLRKQAESQIAADDRENAGRSLVEADSVLALAEAADGAWIDPLVSRGWITFRRSQLDRGLAGVPWLDSASQHAERALKRRPNNAEALALRGTVRYRRWQLRVSPDRATMDSLLQNARADLENAIRTDPSLARANVTLSSLLYQVDDVPGALLAARRAYEEDAYLEQADRTLYRLFQISLDLEQLQESWRWCTEGARRFPADHRFTQCQLELMSTPAVPASAAKAWQLLQRLDSLTPPSERPLTMALGRIFIGGAIARQGLVDSARNVLRTARDGITAEVDRTHSLLAREAYARTLTREPDVAIDLLKRYVAANPGHPFAESAGTVWWWREIVKHPRWREVAQPAP